MGISTGDFNNMGKKDLIKSMVMVGLVYDLIFFVILSLFVYSYIRLTPFYDLIHGFFAFVGMVVLSFVSFVVLDTACKERDWTIFSEYRRLKDLVILNRIAKGNDLIILLIFIFVWMGVAVYTPGNTYHNEYKPNVISWLNKGECGEIKKWDKGVELLCFQMVEARKNLKGIFTVAVKKLHPTATGCTYMLHSADGLYVTTNRVQGCNFAVDQKVFAGISLSRIDGQNGEHDKYEYSVQVD